MSKSTELTLEQIKLSLSDYQSELKAIDAETIQEKERILAAIQAEEAEIKSLLNQYRSIKRQKEIEVVKSSYDNLSDFKQTLLSKIQSETEAENGLQLSLESQPQLESSLTPTMEGGEVKKISNDDEYRIVNQKVKVIELIQFIEGMGDRDLVKLYPADVAELLPSFEINNTVVRDELLKYYQQHNTSIYNALLKLYQKPNLDRTIQTPNIETLSSKDQKYYNFLETHYPKSLPFFWFLIDREPDSIRYVVMEFAIDHIIQTNTVENDPSRQELTLKLPELLEMNNNVSLSSFLQDIFLCFHPRRVSQKANSKNKYFDYVNNLIKTQSTLEHSDVLLLWNYLLESGYYKVSAAEFVIPSLEDLQRGKSNNTVNQRGLDLTPASQDNLL